MESVMEDDAKTTTDTTGEKLLPSAGDADEKLLPPANGDVLPPIPPPATAGPVIAEPAPVAAVEAPPFVGQVPSQTPPPIAVPQAPTTLTKTPFERSIREIGLRPSQVKAAPAAQTPATAPLRAGELQRVRTYAADMSEEIRKRGETLTTIVGAERQRSLKETALEEEPAGRSRSVWQIWLILAGAALLIVLGIGAVVGVIVAMHKPAVAIAKPDIINVNSKVPVAIDGNVVLTDQLAAARNSASLSLGDIESFSITRAGARLTPEETLNLLGAPSTLARNATDVLIGVHSFDRNQPFILITTSAYDLSFAAMLSWENTMGENLGAFFAPSNASGNPPPLSFTDKVRSNTDTRESQESWHIVYAFPRKDVLLITTNEATIREVMTRLSLQKGI